MKNIQTGNDISLVEVGNPLENGAYTAYYEKLEADMAWVICTIDASGEYYAVLNQNLETIAQVTGEPCMDDALSSLESLIDQRIETGDDTPILKKWHCPQTLGV
jgi:hypothetical protein